MKAISSYVLVVLSCCHELTGNSYHCTKANFCEASTVSRLYNFKLRDGKEV